MLNFFQKNKQIVLIAFLFVYIFFNFSITLADTGKQKALEGLKTTATDNYEISEETNSEDFFATLIGKIVGAGLSFLGVIFLVLMIYGGFLWMTARGNEQTTIEAKNLITSAIIGLIIVLSAYAITSFVGDVLTKSN